MSKKNGGVSKLKKSSNFKKYLKLKRENDYLVKEIKKSKRVNPRISRKLISNVTAFNKMKDVLRRYGERMNVRIPNMRVQQPNCKLFMEDRIDGLKSCRFTKRIKKYLEGSKSELVKKLKGDKSKCSKQLLKAFNKSICKNEGCTKMTDVAVRIKPKKRRRQIEENVDEDIEDVIAVYNPINEQIDNKVSMVKDVDDNFVEDMIQEDLVPAQEVIETVAAKIETLDNENKVVYNNNEVLLIDDNVARAEEEKKVISSKVSNVKSNKKVNSSFLKDTGKAAYGFLADTVIPKIKTYMSEIPEMIGNMIDIKSDIEKPTMENPPISLNENMGLLENAPILNLIKKKRKKSKGRRLNKGILPNIMDEIFMEAPVNVKVTSQSIPIPQFDEPPKIIVNDEPFNIPIITQKIKLNNIPEEVVDVPIKASMKKLSNPPIIETKPINTAKSLIKKMIRPNKRMIEQNDNRYNDVMRIGRLSRARPNYQPIAYLGI